MRLITKVYCSACMKDITPWFNEDGLNAQIETCKVCEGEFCFDCFDEHKKEHIYAKSA